MLLANSVLLLKLYVGVNVMLVIFQIPLLKVIKSIMNLRQLLMHLIIILLMLVLQSLQTFHMSMEVSMINLIRNVTILCF